VSRLGCGLLPAGDAEVAVVEKSLISPSPLIRSAQNVANGRRRGGGGSTPYYTFAAQPRPYAFMWHGWPGGVPHGYAAAESRELSGSGDLYESGLSPYSMDYPPLAHRGFTPRDHPLSGLWSDLSDNEHKLVVLAAAAGAAFLAWRRLRKKRRNPARRSRPRRRRR